ncbi:MAG TPA: tetratricopeptide repeat protein [Gammaproteobacteria bacterium]
MASVWAELKRRNVVKVAAAYAIVAWILIEVASVMAPALNLPDWSTSFVAFLMILGLPVALVLSWAFELTPDGMAPTKSVPLSESITATTGRKLDFAIIGLLLAAVGYLVIDNYLLTDADAPALAAATDEQPSIAVLPFDNRSAREEDRFFVDGMHDDILTQLARIDSLRVISRTSVMSYRDTDLNMRDIGEELGVATILEGGVQRAGETVRINVQLIDAATDEHLWAETYDRELTAENVFAIQSAMAMAIAGALQASLTPEEVARIEAVPTQNTRALDFFLSGNDYFNRTDDETYKPLAAEQYQRAIDEDPRFAVAWAALSRTHSTMYWYGIDVSEGRIELAEAAANRALELAPDSAEGHVALGMVHDLVHRDYESAQREYAIAEATIGNDPYLTEIRAYMNRRMGDWREAATLFESLVDRDPRNSDMLFQLGMTHISLREYDEARSYWARVLEIEPDSFYGFVWLNWSRLFGAGDLGGLTDVADNDRYRGSEVGSFSAWLAAYYSRDGEAALEVLESWDAEAYQVQGTFIPMPLFYGWTYSLMGREDLAEPAYEEARARAALALAVAPDDARVYAALAQALAGLGNYEAAYAAAERVNEIMPRSRDDMSAAWHEEALIFGVYAPAGDVETVVAELDEYLSSSGVVSIEGFLPNPGFDPVRDDPRFQELVEKYRRR